MTLPLHPVLLPEALPLDAETRDALKDFRAPGATTSRDDRFLGALLPVGSDAHSGARGLFPLSALVEMDEGQGPSPEILAAGSLRKFAAPAGWTAWGTALGALSADRAILEVLLPAATDMVTDLAKVADAFSVSLDAYFDLVCVITPEGAVLYPEWLGEITRAVAGGPKGADLPAGLVRVMAVETTSNHGEIAARRALDDLVARICQLTLFDGLLAPQPIGARP